MLIQLNVDHDDLVSLVMGTSPYYSAIENELLKSVGGWAGGFVDEWRWNRSAVKKATDRDLLRIYRLCKDSWEDK